MGRQCVSSLNAFDEFVHTRCISIISAVQIQDRTILQSEVNSAVLQLEEFLIDKAFLNFQGIQLYN